MYVYISIWAITLMICDHTYHHVTDFCFFDTHGTPYAQEYLKRHLKGGDSFLAVMLRMEFMDYDSVAKCRDHVETLVREMKEQHNLNAVFLTTDIGHYGSQETPEFIGSRKASEYIESVLAAAYGEPTTLKEYEQTFETIISQHNSSHPKYKHYNTSEAYISTLQKVIASRATCMLLIGRGNYQKHAKSLYYKLNRLVPEGLCIQQYITC